VDLAAALLIAVLIGYSVRRLPPGDVAYCAAAWLLVLCFPTPGWPLQSGAR
jgi:hypothetical protein